MTPLKLLTVAALLAPAGIARATETTVRTYAIPGHGSLEVAVPLRWKEQILWSDADMRPTLRFSPEAAGRVSPEAAGRVSPEAAGPGSRPEHDFVVSLVPAWQESKDARSKPLSDRVKALVE